MVRSNSGFSRGIEFLVLFVLVAALVLPLLHLFDIWPHGGGDKEPSSKRYDRISFLNASELPVKDVRIKLYSDNPNPGDGWWDCPVGSGGWVLKVDSANTIVGPGQSVTWVLNHLDLQNPTGVLRVVCELEYDNPKDGGLPYIATCELQAYPDQYLNAADFWFGYQHEAGGAQPPHLVERMLCGQALMTHSEGSLPNRSPVPHVSSGRYKKPD